MKTTCWRTSKVQT